MIKTIQRFSDSEIKKALKSDRVTQVKIINEPFILNVHKCQTKGTWFYVSYSKGRTLREKICTYPQLSAKELGKTKGRIIEKFILSESLSSAYQAVGDLLDWYLKRALADKTLTHRRRINIESIIKKFLIPYLSEYRVNELNKQHIDEMLWSMQESYSIAYIRAVFSVLKTCFKKAEQLEKIQTNNVKGMAFTDFIKTKLRPKGSKLSKKDLARVIEQINAIQSQQNKVFVLMMLLHGTRIGETRQIKWQHIDFENNEMTLPSHIVKNRQAHTIPLTTTAKEILIKYKQEATNEYLFTTTRKSAMSDVTASLLIQEISQREWTAHDLRKVARTCWADLSIDYFISELLLNHTPSQLDRAYIHTYANEQKLEALNKWHDYLKSLGKISI